MRDQTLTSIRPPRGTKKACLTSFRHLNYGTFIGSRVTAYWTSTIYKQKMMPRLLSNDLEYRNSPAKVFLRRPLHHPF